MHNHKLFDLLKTCSKKEIKWFDLFMGSPFFNRNEDVFSLWKLLKGYYPKFSEKKVRMDVLFQVLFPTKPLEEQKLYDLSSSLFGHLCDFIVWLSIDRNRLLKQHTLLKELNRRNISRLFKIEDKSTEKMIGSYSHRNEDFYRYKYLLAWASDDYFMKQESRKADLSLQEKVDNLDIFYLSAKLKDTCEMINRQNIINCRFDFHLVKELRSHIEQNFHRYSKIYSIMIYYRILLMLLEPDKHSHYEELTGLISAYSGQFPYEEARGMYKYAENHCIRQINQGNGLYSSRLFDLFRSQIKQDLILEGKHITQWDYKNIITIGLRLKHYDWVEQFIFDFKDKIAPEFRDNAFNYNLANFYYEKGDTARAIKLLQTVQFTDVYYNLSARNITMMIYYERGDSETLYSFLNAFRIYLKRTRVLSSYHYDTHMNLIRFAKKICDLKLNMPKKKTPVFMGKLNALEKKISETKDVALHDWLLEKIDQLKKE